MMSGFWRSAMIVAVLFLGTTVTAWGQYRVECGEWSATAVRQVIRYDPFEPRDEMSDFDVRIKEAGRDRHSNIEDVCDRPYAPTIFFWAREPHSRGGHHMRLDTARSSIEAPDGSVVSFETEPATQPAGFRVSVQDGETHFRFRVRLPAGQAGLKRGWQFIDYQYDSQILERNCRSKSLESRPDDRRFTRYGDCGPFEVRKSQKNFRIPVIGVDSASLRIAGAGRRAKVDFGELEQGEQRHLSLIARATRPYAIRVVSRNKGVLLREAAAEPDASIAFEVSIDGDPLDLRLPAEVSVDPSDGRNSQHHRMVLSVGDPSKARAGMYSDQLTLEIVPTL